MKRVLGLLLLASWMGCGSADNAENAANQVDPSAGVEENTTADALNEALGEDEDADQAKMLEGLAKALQDAEPEGILQDAAGIDFGGGPAPAAGAGVPSSAVCLVRAVSCVPSRAFRPVRSVSCAS